MIIIGIDPGQTGGLARVDVPFESATSFLVTPMPTIPKPKGGSRLLSLATLTDQLRYWRFPENSVCRVFIERAHAMPKQGVTSMFNYGMGFGQIEGILAALTIPYTMVEARTWTKAMWEGTSDGDPKARSLIVARRLFPGVKLTVGKGTVPHKGIVDALLIAEYGRRSLSRIA